MVEQVFKRAISKRKTTPKQVDEDLRLENASLWKELYTRGFSSLQEWGWREVLAGPTNAAVILPENCKIPGLNDSKKIPKSQTQRVKSMNVLQNAIRDLESRRKITGWLTRLISIKATKLGHDGGHWS